MTVSRLPTDVPSRIIATFSRWSFAGSRPGDTDDDRLRKALLMGGSLLILPVAVIWGLLYLHYGARQAAAVTLGYAAADAAGIAYLRATGQRAPLSFVHWFCTLLLPFVLTIVLGGIAQSSVLILGALMAPLGALLYQNARRATWLFLAYVALVAATGMLDPFIRHENGLPEWLILALFVLNVIIVSALAFFQMRAFVRQRDEALRMLRAEQAKSEGLLVNILPKKIADTLKDEPKVIAECFEHVSILFVDVVGYTPLTTTVGAAELVSLLNEVYTYFDDVVERHGLEKIRTMGDGYMAAAGVPEPRADHAQAVARAALDMMRFLDKWRSPQARTVSLRMGINSGMVMAGVIGRKKFSYDVWGDPVNIASRMESTSLPGRIQVARDTYVLLKDEFILEPRGTIYVKGKGELETWFLVAERVRSTTPTRDNIGR